MRISKCFFAAALACCAIGSLHAGTANRSHHKKLYVNKDSIEFCEEGIRIKTDKGMVTTKAVHVDKNGAYFFESEAVKFEEKGRWFTCPGCGDSFGSRDELRIHERYCPKMRR